MNDRERLAHIEQAARNMEGEASMIARLAAELRGRVEEQADSPIAPDVPSARPGEGLGTEGSNPSPASPVKPCPDVPFGSLGNDVEETLDALLGFGRSARMVERAQLRNEIAGLLARRTSAPSPIPTRVKTNFVEHPLGIEVHEILSDGSSRFVVVVPSESLASNLAPSPVRKCAGCGNNLLHPDEVCCPPASAQGDEGESAIEEMIDTYGSCVGGEDLKQRARAELASLRAEVERLRAEHAELVGSDARTVETLVKIRTRRLAEAAGPHADVLARLRQRVFDLEADVDRLRTALAEKEKAGVDVAVRDVLAERAKQRAKWTDGHDDRHDDGSLAAAAAVLAHPETEGLFGPGWAFDLREKRQNERERCVISAALLLAEIERRDRRTALGAKERERA